MRKITLVLLILFLNACISEKKKQLTAQEIIDKSIEVSGGKLHNDSKVSFLFRGRNYISEVIEGKKTLKRITYTDSLRITDVKRHNSFQRFFNDSLIQVSDSIATRYSNSVNSVHYFARLPYGLNDSAVKKELLGEKKIKDKNYYKVQVTFTKENGGEDFDDIYIYWFDKETFKPEFLAYEFHVDGGGVRFREAYNERYIGNIRFVDYNNFKPKNKNVSIFAIDSLFQAGELELLSKIELDSVKVVVAN
ncbi:hypothetical protein MTsPCn9_04470 [Croceitalea sp. MTPC9]|uniref:DUF6503 family protein n=1 Tax=unclassified Croceitalea TaxID=2632280 RepID=UPI002B3D8295|nr:hypothetical protein MTsPCn6_04240 [Croceitalea sp. MTPC6]GMN15511.1 hypothetical protein MTsPCn9_04470 [Croceitalea sp. MTPC9]